jgi:hypothetical protein
VTVSWAADNADSYRVQRNDGIVFETSDNFLKDSAVKAGTRYEYQVTALGWAGKASAPTSVDITMKALECPPTPPAPTIRLDDLPVLESKNGWGKHVVGKSISGKPLQVNGKTYANGFGAHAPALAVYAIPAGAARFVAVVGIDEAVKNAPQASVVFQVYGDVKEMGEKPVLIAETPLLSDKTIRVWTFDLELNTRYKELRLVVTNGEDSNNSDHADWVDAGFHRPARESLRHQLAPHAPLPDFRNVTGLGTLKTREGDLHGGDAKEDSDPAIADDHQIGFGVG